MTPQTVFAIATSCVIVLGLQASAWTAERTARAVQKSPEVQRAVQRALDFLAANQNADGSWSSGSYQRHPAITGLAGLAFLSAGSTPLEGPHARRIHRAIEFLLSQTNPTTGLIGGSSPDSPVMYAHGFAVLFLAEAYGMGSPPALEHALRRATALIVQSQRRDGGWRYEPLPVGESDLSVTVCQVMALRAARNAGIAVPKGVIDDAITYVKHSANPNGAFRYMLGANQHTSFALTAAGLTALYSAGVYDAPELQRGLNYLFDFLRRSGYRSPDYFLYGHYYAAQAFFQAGSPFWELYYRDLSAELLRQQRADGGWNSKEGDVFGTAVAAILLQMPNQYLPIFER